MLFVPVFAVIKIITKKQASVFVVIFLSIFVAYAMTNYETDKRNELWQAEEKEVTAWGNVSKLQESEYGWNVYLENVTLSGKRYNQLLVKCDDNPQVNIGNRIVVNGNLSQFEQARNYGNFDSRKYYMSIGIYAGIKADEIKIVEKSYDYVRENLYEARCDIIKKINEICDVSESGAKTVGQIFCVCKDKASIFSAILLGDKSELDSEIKDLYSISGISHILAISGLHISFIGMFFYSLLRKRFKFGFSATVSIILVVTFGIISGMGIATIRAVVMFGLKLIGEVLGRIYDYLTAISTAGIMLMLWNPFVIFNSGFQMSFAAIISITLVWPMVCNILQIDIKTKSKKSKLKRSLLFGINIGMIMNPIIAFNYYQLPSYSFLLNIVVVPLMSIVIVSGILGIGLAYLNLWIGRIAILPGCVILEIYTLLCKWMNKLPFANEIVGKPSEWIIIAYYVILIGFICGGNLMRNKRNKADKIREKTIEKNGRVVESKAIRIARQRRIDRRFRIEFAIAYVVLNLIIYNPARELFRENKLEVTFLDVGQGDGIFIRAANGKTITVDGGSTSVDNVGKYRIISFLKAKAIGKIDYAIVTHADSDHISGLMEMINESDNNGVKVKNLVMPNINLKDDAYMELVALAQNHNVNVLYISKGNKMKLGDVDIECLYPHINTKKEDRNDCSTVLEITYDKFSMLLTGDISTEPEAEVMNMLRNNYTLLKVAHHGSKYSTSEGFLARVNPKYSVISVGEHNLYDHPSDELLERLQQSGSEVFRTDENGGLTISTDGEKMKLEKTIENCEVK